MTTALGTGAVHGAVPAGTRRARGDEAAAAPSALRRSGPSGGLAGRAVMADVFGDFHGQVIIGFPSGHTVGPAMTLPLGVQVRVVAPSKGQPKLVVEESAVE